MNLYFPAQSWANQSVNPTGHWLLQTKRAITVVANGGGRLHIARGQVWATLGSAHGAPYFWRYTPVEPCAMLKDYFLNAGDTLVVPPGARVVMESMALENDLPAAFDWDFATPPEKIKRANREALLLATAEMCSALSQAGRALRRLAGAALALAMISGCTARCQLPTLRRKLISPCLVDSD